MILQDGEIIAMVLQKYIDIYHHGIKNEFAREFGFCPQNIKQMLEAKSPFIVIIENDLHHLAQIKKYIKFDFTGDKK